ncbi:hypothetical protein BGZ60DRAFT_550854 [Tricladium varicosporioides]|nr:hypothetical protein BGZ60DRAFT_550854 [Hymenoscyphus varicosporioides]
MDGLFDLGILTIAYRSVPWKYLNPAIPNTKQLLIPHIQHTLQAVRDHDGFQSLLRSTRVDLVLTLVEASRFPNIEWKRFAITFANEVAHDLEDQYIHSCIAQRESLLYRIAGDKGQAARVIQDVSLDEGQPQPGTDIRIHNATGQKVIQRALNHFQYEELSRATEVLNEWRPLYQTPTMIEETVLFRIHILLGKIFRFQGKFGESLAYLEMSQHMADQRQDLFFNKKIYAIWQRFLRREIARQCQSGFPARTLLRLSLAESLFAQKRYAEAEALCLEVTSQPNLSKMEALRLSITLAKLRHVGCDWVAALNMWTEALVAINKLPPTSGHATRIIFLSVCDILRHQGQHQLEAASRKHLIALEKLSGQAEAKYWIAGLSHWLNHLESTAQSSHL